MIEPGEYHIVLGLLRKGYPWHMVTRHLHDVEIKFPIQGEGIKAFLEETSDIIQGKVMEVAKENKEPQVKEQSGLRLQQIFRDKFRHRYGGAVSKWGTLSQPERDLWAEVENELAEASFPC